MSFAADVKKELTKVMGDNCCQLAELSALLRSNGEIFISNRGMMIDYITQNPTIAKRVVILLKSVYQSEIELITKKQRSFNMRNQYIVRILDNIDLILKELELMDGLTHLNSIPHDLTKVEC